jgi:hypothetical protein
VVRRKNNLNKKMKKLLVVSICFYATTTKAQIITLAKNTKLVYNCSEGSGSPNYNMNIAIEKYDTTAKFSFNVNFYNKYNGSINITGNSLRNATDIIFNPEGIYTHKKEDSINYTGLWISKKLYKEITTTKIYYDRYYASDSILIEVKYTAAPVAFSCMAKGKKITVDAIKLKSEIVNTQYTKSYSTCTFLKDEKNPIILERVGILMSSSNDENVVHSMRLKTIN